jgi:hypothetical protein
MATGNGLSFIFDTSKNETPESLARKRALAAAIMGNIGNRPARNAGEGIGNALASIGQGIQVNVLNRRADAAAKAGQDSANAAWNPLLASFGGQQFPPAPGAPDTAGDTSSAAPTMDYPSQRVAQAFGDAASSPEYKPLNDGVDWLAYANQGAIRNQPLSDKLTGALGSFLPEMGVTMKVFSGGQDANGPRRTGSHRHDHGNAADVFFYKDGRQLSWNNPQDLPIFEDIVRRGRAAGITGFGAGDGYMRPGSMHIGFGSPAVWGSGGRGSNAPDWLRTAFNSPEKVQASSALEAVNAMAGQPTQVASADPSIGLPQQAPVPEAAPALPDPRTIQDMPVASAPQPIQTAQAQPSAGPSNLPVMAGGSADAIQPSQAGPSLQMLMQAAQNPWLNETQRGVIQMMLKQRLDPNAALDTEYKRAQIDYYKRRGGSLINAGNGNIYDPQTGQWISAPAPEGDAPLFDGKSVQAQGLNYLVRTGELTKDQAAQLAAGKTITDPSTGAITFMTPQGLVTQPGNGGGQSDGNGQIPLTGPKKPTDTEYATGIYADRMTNAGKIIEGLEGEGTSLKDSFLNGLPLGNYMVSGDYQKFDQAQRDFINAVLRRESGAVISDEEFANARKQYLPQPGDTPEVLEQKRLNRQIAIDGMRRAAGPGYNAGQPSAPSASQKRLKFNPATGELE